MSLVNYIHGTNKMNRKSRIKAGCALLSGWILAVVAAVALAQEGHPLTGSWSGSRIVDGKSSRVLMVMELQRDRTISGYVMEQGKRAPLEAVVLDPQTWSVSFTLAAADSGLHYKVEATFEDMGSATNRKLIGKWTEGNASGDFMVGLN